MRRAPALVLVAGIVAAGSGVVLLALSAKEVEGVAWLGGGIAVGGFLLIGLWLRDARRPAAADGEPQGLPGRWYPWAILAILALLLVLVRVWFPRR